MNAVKNNEICRPTGRTGLVNSFQPLLIRARPGKPEDEKKAEPVSLVINAINELVKIEEFQAYQEDFKGQEY